MLALQGRSSPPILNCQRDIGWRIISQGGDYVLALKGDRHALHADVTRFFAAPERDKAVIHSTTDNDHGRIGTRASLVSTNIDRLLVAANGRVWPPSAGSFELAPRPERSIENDH